MWENTSEGRPIVEVAREQREETVELFYEEYELDFSSSIYHKKEKGKVDHVSLDSPPIIVILHLLRPGLIDINDVIELLILNFILYWIIII